MEVCRGCLTDHGHWQFLRLYDDPNDHRGIPAKRFVEAKLGEHYLLEQTLNEQKQSLELKLVGEPLSKQAVAQLEASLENYALPDYQLKVNVYSANKEGQFDAKVLAEILQVENQGTSKFLGLD